MLYRLTTPLSHRQFIYIGYKKSLKTYTAPRANEYTLDYYDHNIIRTNQMMTVSLTHKSQKNFSSKHHMYLHSIYLIANSTTSFLKH